MKKISYFLLALLTLATACEKDTEPTNFAPTVTTGAATDIYRIGATLSGSISQRENSVVKEYGFLLSNFEKLSEATTLKVDGDAGSFSVTLNNLLSGTTYYYCAYASSGYSRVLGDVKTFTTSAKALQPMLGDVTVKELTPTTCTVEATVTNADKVELTEQGFCYVVEQGTPTMDDHKVTVVDTTDGTFSTTLSGLTARTVYVIRAYAVNETGVAYSDPLVVTTKKSDPTADDAVYPEVE